jgi:hypothetical protein
MKEYEKRRSRMRIRTIVARTPMTLMALSEASDGHTTTGHLRDGRSAYPGRAGVPHPGS